MTLARRLTSDSRQPRAARGRTACWAALAVVLATTVGLAQRSSHITPVPNSRSASKQASTAPKPIIDTLPIHDRSESNRVVPQQHGQRHLPAHLHGAFWYCGPNCHGECDGEMRRRLR